MLSGFKHGTERDLSTELADPREWQLKDLRHLDILLDVSAVAYDPVSDLLALGTDEGHIRILGGPGVVMSLENGAPVKSLQFASSAFKLVCLDGSERLRVWDLSNLQDAGKPRLVSSTSANEPISAISTSPSHSQVFVIPLSSNTKLKVFDLVTSTWSSHPLPNFWGIHEDKMLASGAIIEKRPNSRQGMLITPHPRNLELLFIAYEGGVALCNLQQTALIYAYELILPPGAPGGSGYAQTGLMTSRYPPVTALSVHPNGHMFAVGHLNGEITFWATEDEDKPLTCITIDEEDVHLVNGEKLATGHTEDSPEREPIFKLAWSGYSNSDDPRGGSSTLSILGGRNDNASGVSVLQFAPYNPPYPPAEASGTLISGLHPFFRAAMRQSVIAQDSYFYTTSTPVVDFLLIPKDSPHFGGSFDPQQIMVIMEAKGGTRSIESRVFPPPQFTQSGQVQPATSIPQTDETVPSLDDDLAATIAAMGIADDPAEIELPLTFWNGKHSPNSVHIIKLERDAHNKLIRERKLEEACQFNGGEAYAEDTHDARLAKFAPHQIVISDHQDGIIRYMDLDPQLLLEQVQGVLTSSFPHHAKELQIDVLDLLGSPAVADHIPSATLASIRVASVQLSAQTLDTVVVTDAGQVIVYKLDGGSGMYWQSDEQDVICLEHISPEEGRRFYPLLMIVSHHGSVTSVAISDIGLLAVAYADGILLVYDLKAHRTVMKEKSKSQKKALFHRAESDTKISSLSWTVSGVKRDPRPRVRLIAVGPSGEARVHTLERRSDNATWEVTNHLEAEGIEEALISQDSSFIFEAKTGFRSRADAHGLTTILSPEILAGGQDDRHWIWVIAGAKGARAYLDINGDRVARADWPAKFGKVIEVKMVERTDAMVLVAYTTQCQALVYSLPKLELLHAFDMPYSGKAPPVISANSTGDYLLCSPHPSALVIQKIVYGTLFGQRRSYYKQPLIDLGAKRKPMPPQPQPVGLGPTSVMNTLVGYVSGPRITTGEDIDFIFTGRQGAAVQSPATTRPVQNTHGTPTASATGSMPDVNAMGQQIGQGASVMGQQIGQGASAVFGRLQSALGERGEMLDSLQNSMKNLQQGSQNALNQARIAAAKQGAKSWLSGF